MNFYCFLVFHRITNNSDFDKFKILVYYYFKTKQAKQNRQQTLKIQTHPSGPDQRGSLRRRRYFGFSKHDAPGSPNPYDRHNASVSQATESAGTRGGRYLPTRSKCLIDRLQTAKLETEELKIKSVDFSKAIKEPTS